MEAILNIYSDCESEQPTKQFICRRLTFKTGTAIEVLSDKIAMLEASKKGKKAEEVKKINEEQYALTIETLQAIFPNFTTEDFDGLDPVEYQEFVNTIANETNKITKRAEKN